MKRIILYVSIIAVFIGPFTSCKKFLDKKPDQSLTVPTTIQDAQMLLDNNSRMNTNCPFSGEGSADSYYWTDAEFDAQPSTTRNTYIWETDIITMPLPNDWSCSYDPVYYANVAIETMQGIKRTVSNSSDWDNTMGSALFFRAKHLFTSATLWAKAYDAQTAATDLGIPLRQTTDFNEPSVRVSVAETYSSIIADTKASAALLPITPLHAMRPSAPAAHALLARIYLSMRVYDSAFKYANLSLQQRNTLLDFNTLSAANSYPVTAFNSEVIMHLAMRGIGHIRNRVDTALFKSYVDNDLRKTIYYKINTDGSYLFRGSYVGTAFAFSGFAVDETLLTRAECYARTGNTASAMTDLNALLAKRWKTGTFVAYTASDANEAISKILTERRKELVFRDTRWMDIKRLNKEGANIVLKRVLKGVPYSLPPNDNRYALPLPEDVISLSNMPQNPR